MPVVQFTRRETMKKYSLMMIAALAFAIVAGAQMVCKNLFTP